MNYCKFCSQYKLINNKLVCTDTWASNGIKNCCYNAKIIFEYMKEQEMNKETEV